MPAVDMRLLIPPSLFHRKYTTCPECFWLRLLAMESIITTNEFI